MVGARTRSNMHADAHLGRGEKTARGVCAQLQRTPCLASRGPPETDDHRPEDGHVLQPGCMFLGALKRCRCAVGVRWGGKVHPEKHEHTGPSVQTRMVP